jgi:hypothetical protein
MQAERRFFAGIRLSAPRPSRQWWWFASMSRRASAGSRSKEMRAAAMLASGGPVKPPLGPGLTRWAGKTCGATHTGGCAWPSQLDMSNPYFLPL